MVKGCGGGDGGGGGGGGGGYRSDSCGDGDSVGNDEPLKEHAVTKVLVERKKSDVKEGDSASYRGGEMERQGPRTGAIQGGMRQQGSIRSEDE